MPSRQAAMPSDAACIDVSPTLSMRSRNSFSCRIRNGARALRRRSGNGGRSGGVVFFVTPFRPSVFGRPAARGAARRRSASTTAFVVARSETGPGRRRRRPSIGPRRVELLDSARRRHEVSRRARCSNPWGCSPWMRRPPRSAGSGGRRIRRVRSGSPDPHQPEGATGNLHAPSAERRSTYPRDDLPSSGRVGVPEGGRGHDRFLLLSPSQVDGPSSACRCPYRGGARTTDRGVHA